VSPVKQSVGGSNFRVHHSVWEVQQNVLMYGYSAVYSMYTEKFIDCYIQDLINDFVTDIHNTIAKISNREMNLALTDVVIFRYLGWDILIGAQLFINGTDFVIGSMHSRVSCGNLNPEIWSFKVCFSGEDVLRIPDEFIKFTKEYEDILTKNCNKKLVWNCARLKFMLNKHG